MTGMRVTIARIQQLLLDMLEEAILMEAPEIAQLCAEPHSSEELSLVEPAGMGHASQTA